MQTLFHASRRRISFELRNWQAEVPGIPFSVEELERANKLKQMLVLRVDKTSDGKPMSLEAMSWIMEERWANARFRSEYSYNHGAPVYYYLGRKLLKNIARWRDQVIGADNFSKVAPRSGWALVSTDLLWESRHKTHLGQTEVIIEALKNDVFKDMPLPTAYAEAIAEFESQNTITLTAGVY